MESKIEKDIIPLLQKEFQNERSMSFFYLKRCPHKKDYNEKTPLHLKYINHPEYWNIFSFRLQLDGGHIDRHDKFWKLVTDRLKNIG